MNKKSIDLSIVIPAYREEKRIGKTLNELSGYLKTNLTMRDIVVEVIIVAADAPDNTLGVVNASLKKFSNLRLLKPGPKVGKGRDVQYGILHAKGAAVLFMDADMATPLKYIEQFYTAYLAGHSIVVATRNLTKHHPSLLRRTISKLGNLLFRILGGVWIEDSQCGFKLFSSEAARSCFSRMTILGWGFDMEILTIAKANGYKIKTYRIDDWISVPEGTFLDSVLTSSLNSFRELVRIFINRIAGRYR